MSAGYSRPAFADWAYYPVKTDLRCGSCKAPSGDWINRAPGGGCQYRAHYLKAPQRIACKNGVPYDCKCNLIQEPYSMAFEAKWPGCVNPRSGCEKPAGRCNCPPNGHGTYYLDAPYFIRDT